MIIATTFIILAYLCGSISSAILVCKFMDLPDPRTEGSGNPGTTNVLRIGGKIPALLVLAGDLLKGLLPVLIASFFHMHSLMLGFIALAAFIGHLYPIFFKFKGGKGVATFFGVIFVLSPWVGLAVGLTWMLIAILFRYSSLAGLIAAITAPVYITIFASFWYLIPVAIMVLLIVWRHRDNIKRLQIGEERKLQFNNLSKKTPSETTHIEPPQR